MTRTKSRTKAHVGNGVVLPLPPPTANVYTKIMICVPPSSAALSRKLYFRNHVARYLQSVDQPRAPGNVGGEHRDSLAEVVLREDGEHEGGEGARVDADAEEAELRCVADE
jgi:hypothetical protein